jgi:hypothetical protein
MAENSTNLGKVIREDHEVAKVYLPRLYAGLSTGR